MNACTPTRNTGQCVDRCKIQRPGPRFRALQLRARVGARERPVARAHVDRIHAHTGRCRAAVRPPHSSRCWYHAPARGRPRRDLRRGGAVASRRCDRTPHRWLAPGGTRHEQHCWGVEGPRVPRPRGPGRACQTPSRLCSARSPATVPPCSPGACPHRGRGAGIARGAGSEPRAAPGTATCTDSGGHAVGRGRALTGPGRLGRPAEQERRYTRHCVNEWNETHGGGGSSCLFRCLSKVRVDQYGEQRTGRAAGMEACGDGVQYRAAEHGHLRRACVLTLPALPAPRPPPRPQLWRRS